MFPALSVWDPVQGSIQMCHQAMSLRPLLVKNNRPLRLVEDSGSVTPDGPFFGAPRRWWFLQLVLFHEGPRAVSLADGHVQRPVRRGSKESPQPEDGAGQGACGEAEREGPGALRPSALRWASREAGAFRVLSHPRGWCASCVISGARPTPKRVLGDLTPCPTLLAWACFLA